MSIRDKLDTMESSELIDIIEIQLAEIKALKNKIKNADRMNALYNSPYNIKVTFNKNKPKPFDI